MEINKMTLLKAKRMVDSAINNYTGNYLSWGCNITGIERMKRNDSINATRKDKFMERLEQLGYMW